MIEFDNGTRLFWKSDRVIHKEFGRGTVTKEQMPEDNGSVSVKFDDGRELEVKSTSILRIWKGYCHFANQGITAWKVYEVTENSHSYTEMRPVDVINDDGEKVTLFAARFVELFRNETTPIGTILEEKHRNKVQFFESAE